MIAAGALTVLLSAACGDDGPPSGSPDIALPDVSIGDAVAGDIHGSPLDALSDGGAGLDADIGPDAAAPPDGAVVDAGPDVDVGDALDDTWTPPDVGPGDPDADASEGEDLPIPFLDVDEDADGFTSPDVGEGDPPNLDAFDDPPASCVTVLDCAPSQCTEAFCDEGLCIYTPLVGACDDQNPCTVGDVCDKGECQAGENVCAEICGNGLDDDVDGLADCADADCAGTPLCDALCGGQESVGCGGMVFDDNAKSSATQIAGGSCGLEAAGSEVIYRFEVPDDLVSVTASVDSDATVELLAPGGNGACEGASCLQGGTGSATWVAEGGAGTMHIVIDAAPGNEGPFALTVTCEFAVVEYCSNLVDDDADDLIDCADPDCDSNPICGAVIEACANGIDDDGDGATDCDDTECVGTFDCVAPPGCDPLYVLACGSQLTDQLGSPGSTDFVDAWACGVSGLDGAEITHSLVAPADAQISVAAAGAPVGSWVLIIEDGQTCQPDACVAAGEGAVTFDAVGGTEYAIVVDAPEGTVGSYELSIACLGLEDCGNGLDDDVDGLTDCEDVDCYGQGACVGQLCAPDAFVGCGDATSGTLGASGDISLSSCGATGDAGEALIAFTTGLPVEAVFSVGGSAAPRIYALDGSGPCDSGYCVWGGGEQASVAAGAGSTWYLLIDSNQSGGWSLNVNCAGHEVVCDDGLDGDADGSTDCGDGDCAGTEGCGAACPVLDTVTCGTSKIADPATMSLPSAVSDYGCAGASGLSGAEAGWVVDVGEAVGPTAVRATLVDPAGAGASVLAVTSGFACDPSGCFAMSTSAVEFDVQAGETPFLVVDRPSGAEGAITLVLNCGGAESSCDDEVDGDGDGLPDCADPDCAGVEPCELAEAVCDDGLDNDGDQLTDCDDLDCASVGSCGAPPGICLPHDDIVCGAPQAGSTNGAGSQGGTVVFGCPDGEVTADQGTMTWVHHGDGDPVTINLLDASESARLVVVESSDGLDCNPALCIASTASQVVIETELEQSYQLVLTGPGPEPASGVVEVVCGVGEIDCDNGVDDNSDGLIDCLDPTCQGDLYCQFCFGVQSLGCDEETTFTTATGAGGTFIVDGTCDGAASPGPERVLQIEPAVSGVVTVDGGDAETVLHVFSGDGEACAADACLGGGPPPLSFYGQQGEVYLVAVDTTGAGLAPVTVSVACAPAAELCTDGLDNDANTLADCDDPWCLGHAACPEQEICDDDVDNDLDGWTDCKDLVCTGAAACPNQEVCGDGVDNDLDGATDCDDYLCSIDPGCGG